MPMKQHADQSEQDRQDEQIIQLITIHRFGSNICQTLIAHVTRVERARGLYVVRAADDGARVFEDG